MTAEKNGSAPRTIVAEVSCNYRVGDPMPPEPISSKFEEVILVNQKRGYRLRDWKLTATPCADIKGSTVSVNETIVAVFERCGKSRAEAERYVHDLVTRA